MMRITLNDGTKKDVYGYSQSEVKQKANEIQKLSEQGVKVDDKTIVDEWYNIWFDKYKSKKQIYTKETYSNAYTHIKPLIGQMPLKNVKPLDIQDVMNSVYDKSESLQHKVLLTLSQMFKAAIGNNLIFKTPCADFIKINKNDREDVIKTLSDEQQYRLLETVKNTRAYLFVAIGLYAGLRREEILGLTWSDIDFKNNVIKVNKCLVFDKNKPVLKPFPKAKSSNRNVILAPPLKEILENCDRETLYVVTDAKNCIMSKSAFRRMWDIANKVDFDVTSHMLRHTYCTMLHKAGIDLKTAQYLMGHANIQMTAKIYTHIEKMQIQNASKKINKYFNSQNVSQNKMSSKKP